MALHSRATRSLSLEGGCLDLQVQPSPAGCLQRPLLAAADSASQWRPDPTPRGLAFATQPRQPLRVSREGQRWPELAKPRVPYGNDLERTEGDMKAGTRCAGRTGHWVSVRWTPAGKWQSACPALTRPWVPCPAPWKKERKEKVGPSRRLQCSRRVQVRVGATVPTVRWGPHGAWRPRAPEHCGTPRSPGQRCPHSWQPPAFLPPPTSLWAAVRAPRGSPAVLPP